MNSHTFTFLLVTLFMSNSLSGQVQVTKDNELISGTHLKPYSNKWKMYAIDEKGKENLITIWTDYAQLIELEGTAYMSRIQELYNPDMTLRELWTNLFEHKTLLPYRATQFKTSGDYIYTQFNSDKIDLITRSGNKEAVKTDYSFPTPPWDWSMYGILLSGLPFEKGKSYSIPIFNQQDSSGKGNVIASIDGEEHVKDDDGGIHKAWKVKTNVGLTFWLTKSAPYVIQLTSPAQSGGQVIWKMFH